MGHIRSSHLPLSTLLTSFSSLFSHHDDTTCIKPCLHYIICRPDKIMYDSVMDDFFSVHTALQVMCDFLFKYFGYVIR